MRGRKPVSTMRKRLRGNPGKRPLNTNEPAAAGGLPWCPRHLYGEARREWHRTGKQLLAEGRMAVLYKATFAAYCHAWGRWVEAEEKVRQHGLVVTAPSGRLAPSPYLTIGNTAQAQMMKAIAELGLSPTSQTRVSVVREPGSTTRLEAFRARKLRLAPDPV